MAGPPNRNFQNNAAGRKAKKRQQAKSFASKYRGGRGVVDKKPTPRKSSGGGGSSSKNDAKYVPPSKANVAGGFGKEIEEITSPQKLLNKATEIYNTKKAKDIRKKADEMFAIIKTNPTLTQFQKNNLREQIQYVKDNHGRLGYSLNELMSAVGTNAFNQIVSRTPVGKDQAEALDKQLVAAGEDPRYVQEVQDIMEKYGRAAVLRKDGSIGAISPTGGQFLGDIGRGAVNMFGNTLIPRLLTGGKGFNVQAPEFGFGDIPNTGGANLYLANDPRYSQFVNSGINLSEGIGAFRDPKSQGAAKALQFAPQRDARRGRTPEETTGEGGSSDDGSGTTPASTFAYQPYALPVSYNYMGGPEQMYLGGGYTQDGQPVGPFYAANGGIANFKDYGY
jgi:hypothetical protein